MTTLRDDLTLEPTTVPPSAPITRSTAPSTAPSAPAGERPHLVRRHLVLAAGLTAVVSIAPRLLYHPNAPRRLRIVGDTILGGWLRWDGWWYVKIAEHGYSYRPGHISSVAFFPLYPLVLRGLGAVLPGGVPLAAIMLTAASGATSMVLFHRWCLRRMTPAAARAAVGALAVYPFAWFLYGAAYSDALFLALVLAAFLLVEDDRPLLAGLAGLLATAARPTGITLVVGLVAIVVERRGLLRRRRPGRLQRRDLGVLLSVGGLAGWCAWLYVRFGNALLFVEAEGAPGWNQSPGPRTWLKLRLFHELGRVPTAEAVSILAQAGLFVAFLCAVPAVWRRLGPGYGVYSLVAITVPAMSTSDFLGVGRYMLPVFPVFAVVGLAAAAPSRRRRAAVVASASLLVVGTALFSAGYLVA